MKLSIFSLFFLSFLALSSCNKDTLIEENITIDDEENVMDENNNSEENASQDCFTFTYPISYTMPDDSTISGDNEEEIEAAIAAWYAANPNDQRPVLVLPVEVTFEDGTTLNVETYDVLEGVYERCDHDDNGGSDDDGDGSDDDENDGEHDFCFDFVYPISFTMPDASTITGENAEEIAIAIAAWYEANPVTDQRPELVFPVDIVFEDGTTATINDEVELRGAHERCGDDDDDESDSSDDGSSSDDDGSSDDGSDSDDGSSSDDDGSSDDGSDSDDDGEHHDCFDFVYPISFIMPDASTITGDDEEEIALAVAAWYENNTETDQRPELVFPVDIVFEDGTTTMINDEVELRGAHERCRDNDDDGSDSDDGSSSDDDGSSDDGSHGGSDDDGSDDDDEYDCPELESNVGDDCRNADGVEGTVTADCGCE